MIFPQIKKMLQAFWRNTLQPSKAESDYLESDSQFVKKKKSAKLRLKLTLITSSDAFTARDYLWF